MGGHIKHTSSTRPELLIPYAYSLYIAVFAGGQILRRRLLRSALFRTTNSTTSSPTSTKTPTTTPGASIFEFESFKSRDEMVSARKDLVQRLNLLPIPRSYKHSDSDSGSTMIDELVSEANYLLMQFGGDDAYGWGEGGCEEDGDAVGCVCFGGCGGDGVCVDVLESSRRF
ncbi:hypothetical protein HK102_007572 [Quaeritorhiza haematococci]|nr:hypothetical protein HK102_007572 [Quaeritorhiza haematococci]